MPPGVIWIRNNNVVSASRTLNPAGVAVSSGVGAPIISTGGVTEPVYNATTDTLLFTGNSADPVYASLTTAGATSPTKPRMAPASSPVVTGGAVDPTRNAIVTGKGGAGLALRNMWSGASQNGAGWESYACGTAAATVTHYIRSTIFLSGTAPTGTLAVKWFRFQLHNTTPTNGQGGAAPQWSTHDHLPYGGGTQQTYWQFYDTGFTDSVDPYPTGHDQGTQPFGPYIQNLFDNNWHRFTYVYRPHSAVGVYDGISQMWIDGKLVINQSATSVGVTPAGGEKQWTSPDNLHNMNVANPPDSTYCLEFGGTQTTVTPAWNMDLNLGDNNPANLDTLVWWYR